MKPRLVSSIALALVLVPGCDSDDAKDPNAGGGGGGGAAAGADAGADAAKADAKGPEGAGADAKNTPPAAEEPSDPCQALVDATREACKHQLATGAETGCMMALMGIKTAAEQAGGQLFDLGPDNQKAADTNCKIHLKKVKKKHAKAKDAVAVTWGPECTKYVAHYDETCLATLGKKERDASCDKPFNAVAAPLRPDNVEGAELGCGMAMQMK